MVNSLRTFDSFAQFCTRFHGNRPELSRIFSITSPAKRMGGSVATHHKGNLNNQFKLKSKLVYDFMELHKLDWSGMGKLIGCHEQTVYNFCKNERIPIKKIFEKLLEVLKVTRDEILAPLVRFGRAV